MAIGNIVFYVIASLIIIASLFLATTKNPIYGACYLMIVLLAVAGLYAMYGSHYMVAVQVLVYAGGIIVLISFIIMLVNKGHEGYGVSISNSKWVGYLIGAGLFLVLLRFQNDFSGISNISGQIRTIGIALMSSNLIAFEWIAYLLLVVLIGAVFLANQNNQANE